VKLEKTFRRGSPGAAKRAAAAHAGKSCWLEKEKTPSLRPASVAKNMQAASYHIAAVLQCKTRRRRP
jgi:hypothetical protein